MRSHVIALGVGFDVMDFVVSVMRQYQASIFLIKYSGTPSEHKNCNEHGRVVALSLES